MKTSLVLIVCLLYLTCKSSIKPTETSMKIAPEVICSDNSCQGYYEGPEFINGSDIAHQYSNTMSRFVGDKLKVLYKSGSYSKVDFLNIEMTTEGMGSGSVRYQLMIPFTRVSDKCDAYTSFDHVGGWNHKPALAERKKQLSSQLLAQDELVISNLKTTKEGLQEHWIQWRNKDVQSECAKSLTNPDK